jgi:chromosome partitioning protein
VSTSDNQCCIIALFNQAGGVAKSTLTPNLGYHLARRKHRVLLIDIDPQASLTKFMGLVPSQLQKTVADAIHSRLTKSANLSMLPNVFN